MENETVIAIIILIVMVISIALACCFVFFAEDLADNSRVEESHNRENAILYSAVHANEI